MRRETRILHKRSGCLGVVDGKEVIIFSSNDYLGLSGHPDIIEAALQAAKILGIGTGGAPGTTLYPTPWCGFLSNNFVPHTLVWVSF